MKYIERRFKDLKGFKITRPIEPQPTDTVKFWVDESVGKKNIVRVYGLFDEQSYFDEIDPVWYSKSICKICEMLIKTLVYRI